MLSGGFARELAGVPGLALAGGSVVAGLTDGISGDIDLFLCGADCMCALKTVFAAAQRMLKNAIEAKTSKADKKLKMIELQLKKLREDDKQKDSTETIKGEGYVIADRNDILKSFIDKDNE